MKWTNDPEIYIAKNCQNCKYNISTIDVIKIAYNNASVEIQNKTQPFQFIKALLRYYIDIPDSPRYLFDLDAIYMYNFDPMIKGNQIFSERADIMMSFWMPFTYCLKLNNEKVISKKENANKIIERINAGDEEIVKVCNLFEKFSAIYATRGNILLLPNMKNKFGNNLLNPNRGCWFEDKLDQCLWHCFEGGRLHDYFKDDKNVIEWIRSEHLECMFIDGNIKRNNIIPLSSNKEISDYKFSKFNDEDWNIFMSNIYKIIDYRNQCEFEPHNPLEW